MHVTWKEIILFCCRTSESANVTLYLLLYPGPTAALAKKKGYKAWTKEEKDEVFKYLGAFVKNEKLPGKRDCENCMKQSEGVLVNRDWTAVKNCVKNII